MIILAEGSSFVPRWHMGVRASKKKTPASNSELSGASASWTGANWCHCNLILFCTFCHVFKLPMTRNIFLNSCQLAIYGHIRAATTYYAWRQMLHTNEMGVVATRWLEYHREGWAHHGGESTEIYSGPSQMEKKRTKALHLRWRLRR